MSNVGLKYQIAHYSCIDWLKDLMHLSVLPKPEMINTGSEDILIRLTYDQFLSNVMIMHVEVLRLGKAKEITRITSSHEPQVCVVIFTLGNLLMTDLLLPPSRIPSSRSASSLCL